MQATPTSLWTIRFIISCGWLVSSIRVRLAIGCFILSSCSSTPSAASANQQADRKNELSMSKTLYTWLKPCEELFTCLRWDPVTRHVDTHLDHKTGESENILLKSLFHENISVTVHPEHFHQYSSDGLWNCCKDPLKNSWRTPAAVKESLKARKDPRNLRFLSTNRASRAHWNPFIKYFNREDPLNKT